MENMYELIDRRTEKVLENIESFRGTKVEVDAVKLARFFGFEVFELKNMSAFDLASLRVSENGSQKDILVNEYYRPAEKRIGIIECISYYLLLILCSFI